MTKIACPFSGEELRDLYVGQLLPVRMITPIAAERLGRKVDDETVRKWIRLAGVQLRNCHDWQRIECPFSALKLQELYEYERLSFTAIAASASELLARRIFPSTVRRWVREIGIAKRSASEVQRAASIHYPNRLKGGRRQPESYKGQPAEFMRRISPKGVRAAARLKREAARVDLVCSNDRCKAAFARRRGDLAKHPSEVRFCCRQCSAAYRSRQSRLKKALASIQGLGAPRPPDTSTWPQWAQEEYARLNQPNA